MNTQKSQHIPYLDGWRGVAIILVLVSHFGDREYSKIGEFGVQMFFVLSGYLMSGLLFIKQVPLSDFFARRFNRIVPTFWVYIATIAIYAAFFQPQIYVVSVKELISTLLFLRTYFPSSISIWSEQWAIGHIWSLNVEEHSYIFLAIGAFLCRKISSRNGVLIFLCCSTIAAFLFCAYYGVKGAPFGASPWSTRSECACLGLVAAAAIQMTRQNPGFHWSKQVPPLLPLLTFLIAVFCFTTDLQKGSNKLIAPIFLAFTINYLDQIPAILKNLLSIRWIGWFGVCSFSLYLWQHPFFQARLHYGMNPVLAVTLAISCGLISFYLLENPLRLKLNRLWIQRNVARRLIVQP